MQKRLVLLCAAIMAALSVSSPAMAAATGGPDFTSLIDSVDLTTVIGAIMAAAGLMVGVAVATMGAKRFLSFIGWRRVR